MSDRLLLGLWGTAAWAVGGAWVTVAFWTNTPHSLTLVLGLAFLWTLLTGLLLLVWRMP